MIFRDGVIMTFSDVVSELLEYQDESGSLHLQKQDLIDRYRTMLKSVVDTSVLTCDFRDLATEIGLIEVRLCVLREAIQQLTIIRDQMFNDLHPVISVYPNKLL